MNLEGKIRVAADWFLRPQRRFSWARWMRGAGLALLAFVMVQYFAMWRSQQRLLRDWVGQSTHESEDQRAGPMRLTIPRIHLDAVVVEGTSENALFAGPGHMQDTALPGEVGNSIIAGHRDTFFRGIQDLHAGDIILVQRQGRSFSYRVEERSIIDPTDIEVLANTTDTRLSLITCYPSHYIGPAPKRLIVTAELVSTGKNELVAKRTHP